jgi:hypothetical protein
LLGGENRAALDRQNVGASEVAVAVTDVSGWSSQLELAQVYMEVMRGLGEKKYKCKSSPATSTNRMRRCWKGFKDTSRSRGSRSAASAGKDEEARRTYDSQRHGGEKYPVYDQDRVRMES